MLLGMSCEPAVVRRSMIARARGAMAGGCRWDGVNCGRDPVLSAFGRRRVLSGQHFHLYLSGYGRVRFGARISASAAAGWGRFQATNRGRLRARFSVRCASRKEARRGSHKGTKARRFRAFHMNMNEQNESPPPFFGRCAFVRGRSSLASRFFLFSTASLRGGAAVNAQLATIRANHNCGARGGGGDGEGLALRECAVGVRKIGAPGMRV